MDITRRLVRPHRDQHLDVFLAVVVPVGRFRHMRRRVEPELDAVVGQLLVPGVLPYAVEVGSC